MKDFEQILQQKKGKGYQIWAQHFNNTQAAEVLIFLQENDIDSYEKLDALAEKTTDHFHELSDEIKTCEARLKEIGNLKKAITDYSKTRSTYEAYRKAGYSKKFFEEHREEITIHKAAKKMFDTLPSKQIPKVKELSAEYTLCTCMMTLTATANRNGNLSRLLKKQSAGRWKSNISRSLASWWCLIAIRWMNF
jgi:hypothetical protein